MVQVVINIDEMSKLKPAFIDKIRKIEKKGKFTNYKSLSALKKEFLQKIK